MSYPGQERTVQILAVAAQRAVEQAELNAQIVARYLSER